MVRQHGAAALGQIGPCAQSAVPTLQNLLLDKHWQMRVRVAFALWQINHQVEVPLPVLVGVLSQGDVEARAESANAIGEIGPAAKSAAPALVRALKDYEFLPIRGAFSGFPCSVSTYACEALKKVDPQAAVRAGLKLDTFGN